MIFYTFMQKKKRSSYIKAHKCTGGLIMHLPTWVLRKGIKRTIKGPDKLVSVFPESMSVCKALHCIVFYVRSGQSVMAQC